MSTALHPRQQARRLSDGRLHLQDGPIDLIVEAVGAPQAVGAAYAAATARFAGILDELCAELPALRRPASDSSADNTLLPANPCHGRACPGHPDRRSTAPHRIGITGTSPVMTQMGWKQGFQPDSEQAAGGPPLTGPIARRMAAAVAPYAAMGLFITPMAAVAGAVAEAVLAAMVAAAPLARASVNNGGDIALHLAPGARTTIGLVDRADFRDGPPKLFGRTTLTAADPVRGIATSGWGGRSFSLGIADAVTVLAASAAQADAAATVIANAVDLPGHPGILRVPAATLQPDSDLGERPVTRAVPRLSADEIAAALDAGAACADDLMRRGLIVAAALHLQRATEVVGTLREEAPRRPPAARDPSLEGGHAHA